MIFSPYVLEPVKAIMGMSEFSDAVLKLPMTGFIINKFSILLLGIIVLTGIILYAKFRGRQSDL
jgi:LPXTG-motif cell wall-anchored protein